MARKKPPQNAEQVLGTMRRLGFDEPFSMGVVCLLDTDFVADRLLRFLRNARPASREVVADELLAIIGDRDKYVQKHVDDYYRRVNTVEGLFLRGFDIDWASPGAAESTRRVSATTSAFRSRRPSSSLPMTAAKCFRRSK